MPISPKFRRSSAERVHRQRTPVSVSNTSQASASIDPGSKSFAPKSPAVMKPALAKPVLVKPEAAKSVVGQASVATATATAKPADGGGETRRINSRASVKSVRCEMTVIAVRLDQTPGDVYWAPGCSVDESGGTLSIMIDRNEPFAARNLILGASVNGPVPSFSSAKILNQWRMDGQLRVEVAVVKESADALLSPQLLTPRIDPANFRFHHGVPNDILNQWESMGVIRRYLVDRVLTCPDCSSLPTWRKACGSCGSARFQTNRLIHHYACAHVGEVNSFETSDKGIHCPKCRASGLIAGTDFQYTSGPLTCLDCHETGCQPVLHCMCHRCLQRFEPTDAREHDVHGYHFERLDLLDLVAASQ